MCNWEKKGGFMIRLIEILQKLDIQILTALIAFIGVIIGAIISSITTFFLDWLKFNRDEKAYYKRKKEEAYIEMQDLIADYYAHIDEMKKTNTINKELRIRYNNIRSKSHIYVDKKISEKFYDVINSVIGEVVGKEQFKQDEWDKLTEDMRKDLK